jgi:hypothetical protein
MYFILTKVEEVERQADVEKHRKQMDEYNQDWLNIEKRYKDKINNMNDNIYKHGMQLNSFTQNDKDPYYLMNDNEFNKRLAELKSLERDYLKNDPTKIQERIRMVICVNISKVS